MKLYATTTSERASKGQGGNKFIKTKITADEDMVIDVLIEDYNEDEWRVRLDLMGEVYFRTSPKLKDKSNCDCNMNYGNKQLQGNHDIDCNSRKGKSQKGENEKCLSCNKIPDQFGRCKCCNKDAF